MRKLILTILCIGAVVAIAVPAANASNTPLQLTFDKTATTPGFWAGSVAGDIQGGLTTELLGLDTTGVIWHVTFDWNIDAGSSSFTARLSGVLNTKTGSVVMDGTIVSGYLLGAQVHEEGQLVSPATSEFAGSIRIMPATV